MISWNIGSSKEFVLSGNRLGAIRQQAITANCDPWRQQAITRASLVPGLCHDLVSLGHNNSGSWLSMMHNIACIIFFMNFSYSNHTNYNVSNFICIQIQTWSIKNCTMRSNSWMQPVLFYKCIVACLVTMACAEYNKTHQRVKHMHGYDEMQHASYYCKAPFTWHPSRWLRCSQSASKW